MNKVFAFFVLLVCSVLEVYLNIIIYAIAIKIINHLTKGRFVGWAFEIYPTKKGGDNE